MRMPSQRVRGEQKGGGQEATHLPSKRVGTNRTKRTVLLCRLANQTIVCSPMGHGRRGGKGDRALIREGIGN